MGQEDDMELETAAGGRHGGVEYLCDYSAAEWRALLHLQADLTMSIRDALNGIAVPQPSRHSITCQA